MHRYFKTINFYDCDPAGILFFARLFEVCHSAYENFMNSFNLKSDYWNNDSYAVPIIHTEAKYLLPLRAGDKISVEVTVSKLKKSSFELKYICKNGDEKITNEIKTVHIFVDKKKWEKTDISTEVKDNLAKHLS